MHCYKYRLIKSGSGGFLAATMLEQDLNSEIKHLQEQELKENDCTKKNAGTSIEINSILVPAQYKFCCNIVATKNPQEPDFISLSALIFALPN